MTNRILLTCLLLIVSLTAGCARTPETSTATAPTSDSLPFVPLPQGATIERAGAEPPNKIITTNLLGSLAPDNRSPGERVPEIISRGRLIVGIDQSQNLLSFRNTITGELQGFEVDIAKEIAADIFGNPTKIEFRYVDSANWIDSLESHQIDMAIRTLSITRDRQDQVFFSTPYLKGSTKILVHKSSAIKGISEIGGRPVCVTSQSTGIHYARNLAPTSDLVVVRSSADCLIVMQQNQASAVITDDVILSGMSAQDPFTTIEGGSLSNENYGIATAKPGYRHHTDGLIRQINATLERIYGDGTWQKYYNHWFSAYLLDQTPPATHYRKETPQRP